MKTNRPSHAVFIATRLPRFCAFLSRHVSEEPVCRTELAACELAAVEKTRSTLKRFEASCARLWLAFTMCFFGVSLAGSALAAGSDGWATIASPNVTGANSNDLEDVTCVSASDCWAVGNFHPGGGPLRTLIQHWDGASWSIVPSPNVIAGALTNTTGSSTSRAHPPRSAGR
jgi:hypothetical protein